MAEVNVSMDISGRIVVSFPYNPLWVEKIKIIPCHRWHPDKKQWSFSNIESLDLGVFVSQAHNVIRNSKNIFLDVK